jgi:transposase
VILLPSAVRVYVAVEPVSLHKSFEGLSNEVRSTIGCDPTSGHVFLFLNRRKTQVKLLLWTRGGFTILHKRLETGRYAFVQQVAVGAKSIEIDADELAMLLEGIDARGVRKSRRWQPAARMLAQAAALSV